MGSAAERLHRRTKERALAVATRRADLAHAQGRILRRQGPATPSLLVVTASISKGCDYRSSCSGTYSSPLEVAKTGHRRHVASGRLQRTSHGLRMFAIFMRFVAVLFAVWITVAGFASGKPILGVIGLLLVAGSGAYATLRLRTYLDSRD